MTGFILWMVLSWSGTFPSAFAGMEWNDWADNPALLGLRNGREFGFSITTDSTDTGYAAGYRVDNLGFILQRGGDSWAYTIGIGFPIYPSGFLRKVAIGYSYSSLDRLHTVGLASWPHRFFSVGGSVRLDTSIVEYRAGIGLRPFTDRLTLWLGVRGDADSDRVGFDLAVTAEPVPWAHLQVTYAPEEKQYRVGVILSAHNQRLGGFSDGNRTDLSIAVSSRDYGVPFRSRKAVKVVLDGEYPEINTRGFLKPGGKTFYSLINSLQQLEDKEDVSGILLVIKAPKLSLSQVEELGAQLDSLRAHGKKIIVFSRNYDAGRLWIASHGDIVVISRTGEVFMPGLFSGGLYFKNMLDTFGIDVDAPHIREYKSAVEPFSRENMSEYDREQRMDYLNDIKNTMWPGIAGMAGISEDSLFSLINSQGIWNDSEAVHLGFVDTALHYIELEKWVRDTLNCKRIIDLDDALKMPTYEPSWEIQPYRIAVLVIEGGIVSGKSGNDILMGKTVGDETIIKAIKKLKKDKSVAAVVVRVNSPGGSALASEEMWYALKELDGKKPVIVSMGNVAASGGYYVSAPGRKIFADSTTLTGSIGILSMKFTFRRMLEKFGINVDYIKIGRHADAMSPITRPLTAEEESLAMRQLRYGYRMFLSRVAESRNMSVERVDSIGRGHIYSGIRAMGLGLVDTIGGLMDAIDYARKIAGIEGGEVVFYPKPGISRLLSLLGKEDDFALTKTLLTEPYLYLMPPFRFGN